MIIGISGFQSSGKDTIADYLVKEHGFVKLSFASALKDIVAIIFGWSREKLEGLKVEDRQWREDIDSKWAKLLNIPCLTPRYVLQYLGIRSDVVARDQRTPACNADIERNRGIGKLDATKRIGSLE